MQPRFFQTLIRSGLFDPNHTAKIKPSNLLLRAPPISSRAPHLICFFLELTVFLQVWLWAWLLHFANAPLFYSFTLSVLFNFFFSFFFISYMLFHLFALFNYRDLECI
jgi:hypothetical protein